MLTKPHCGGQRIKIGRDVRQNDVERTGGLGGRQLRPRLHILLRHAETSRRISPDPHLQEASGAVEGRGAVQNRQKRERGPAPHVARLPERGGVRGREAALGRQTPERKSDERSAQLSTFPAEIAAFAESHCLETAAMRSGHIS
eukprot:scaffold1462_cov260-Pinguiococcus_pyrenoidosus.AAC.12